MGANLFTPVYTQFSLFAKNHGYFYHHYLHAQMMPSHTVGVTAHCFNLLTPNAKQISMDVFNFFAYAPKMSSF